MRTKVLRIELGTVGRSIGPGDVDVSFVWSASFDVTGRSRVELSRGGLRP